MLTECVCVSCVPDPWPAENILGHPSDRIPYLAALPLIVNHITSGTPLLPAMVTIEAQRSCRRELVIAALPYPIEPLCVLSCLLSTTSLFEGEYTSTPASMLAPLSEGHEML
jgi:hypothetical protein